MEAARPERPEEQSPGGLDERTGFSGPYYKLSLVIFSVIDRLVEIAIDREQMQIDRLMESEKNLSSINLQVINFFAQSIVILTNLSVSKFVTLWSNFSQTGNGSYSTRPRRL